MAACASAHHVDSSWSPNIAMLEIASPREELAGGRGKMTASQAVLVLVATFIGISAIALPSVMKDAGWISGTILMVLTAVTILEMGRLIDHGIRQCNKVVEKAGGSAFVLSYDDFGYASLGTLGLRAVQLTVTLNFIGFNIIYIIVAGQNLQLLLPLDDCDKPQQWQCILIVAPVFFALSLLPDLNCIARLSGVCTIVGCVSLLLICYSAAKDAMYRESWPVDSYPEGFELHSLWPASFLDLGSATAVLFCAFTVMGTVPTIRGEMANPEEFLGSFRLAAGIVTLLFFFVMALGYWGYGNFVAHNVTFSMAHYPVDATEAALRAVDPAHELTGPSSDFVSKMMAVFVTVNLFFVFPIHFKVIMDSIERVGGGANFAARGLLNRLVRAGLLALEIVASITLPHFRPMLGIVGAVCSCGINLIFPLAFNYALGERGVERTRITIAAHVIFLLFGVFCVVFGLLDSIKDLLEALARGLPITHC